MSNQLPLPYEPIKHAEVNEVAMGVLPNGETYLSLNGLAHFCGVNPSTIKELSSEWSLGTAQTKPRGVKILNLILEWSQEDTAPEHLYALLENNGSTVHAVPEVICMALLDYYDHYADPPRGGAIKNYRIAARFGLRQFVYKSLDYDEKKILEESWNLFKERILLNETPANFFTIFDESTKIIASLLKYDIPVDDSIMPDGSIGITWARFWKQNNFDEEFGPRQKIMHKFPESYRQLDPEIWAYPASALGKFRQWLDLIYLQEKYPNYIQKKIKDGKISSTKKPLLLQAVQPPSIGHKKARLLT